MVTLIGLTVKSGLFFSEKIIQWQGVLVGLCNAPGGRRRVGRHFLKSGSSE